MIKTIYTTKAGLIILLFIGFISYNSKANIFQPLWQSEKEAKVTTTTNRKVDNLQWLPIPLDCELEDGNKSIRDYKTFRSVTEGRNGVRILQKKRIDIFYVPPEGKHVEPDLSKDGSKVVCTSMTGEYAKTWLYDFATGRVAHITPETVSEFSPINSSRRMTSWREEMDVPEDIPIAELSWAPDNKGYVFASGKRLYMGFVGIEKPLVMLEGANVVNMPRWSPDGRKIVYVSSKGDGAIDLFLITNVDEVLKSAQDGKEVRANSIQLTGSELEEMKGWEFLASWYSNSERIVYSAERGADDKQKKGVVDYDICALNLSASQAKEVLINFVRDQYFPVYSPDGNYLAFYSNLWRDQNRFNDDLKRFAIFAKGLSDTESPLPQRTGWIKLDDRKGPIWSPDGEFLIYIKHSVAEQFPIYAQRLVDKHLTRLTNPKGNPNNEFVDISGNGKIIAFCSQSGYEVRLHVGIVNFRGNRR